MNTKAVARIVTPDHPVRTNETDWIFPSYPIVIGKDVLELLSSAMYLDPMTIYREYIQNAADAIDQARTAGEIKRGNIQVYIDAEARSVRIRDNGAGLPWKVFVERLTNIGASPKRGTPARGFRGVGRLAGLGYCQSLIFRSRASGEEDISEMRWDCRQLKSSLRAVDVTTDLAGVIRSVVTVRRIKQKSTSERFFEVELQGIIRHRNDRLLNAQAVEDYLSQVAPVPFHPDFRFANEISATLRAHVSLGDVHIHVNGSQDPIYRPFRNFIETDTDKRQRVRELEVKTLKGSEGDIAAVLWLLHHDYTGAIPNRALIKGIRFRVGNIQVGEASLLEELFPEPRFNSWSIGEVHVIDQRLVANGRRDHFEHGIHLDNLFNQLAPVARDITRRCRQSSLARKWARDFELHRDAAFEKAKIVSRGGLSRAAKRAHAESAEKSLHAMRKAAAHQQLPEEIRQRLASEAEAAEMRITKLLGSYANATDPLDRFRPETRSAFRRVIDLIYQCASNRSAAAVLVEKILTKLAEEQPK